MMRFLVRHRLLLRAFLAMVLLLPSVHGWAWDDCCPDSPAAATAGSQSAVPAPGGDSPDDQGDAPGSEGACPCAFCQVTLGNAFIPGLSGPNSSQRIEAPASRELSSHFLSEIYRPPLA